MGDALDRERMHDPYAAPLRLGGRHRPVERQLRGWGVGPYPTTMVLTASMTSSFRCAAGGLRVGLAAVFSLSSNASRYAVTPVTPTPGQPTRRVAQWPAPTPWLVDAPVPQWYRHSVRFQGGSVSITASEARRQLFPLIEQVNSDRVAIEITSRRGNAVLISARSSVP